MAIKVLLNKSRPPVVQALVHGKTFNSCIPSQSDLFTRALKRMKAYSNLDDYRPTLRNKPSGLRQDWHRTTSRSSTSSRSSLPSQSLTLSKSLTLSRSSTLSRPSSQAMPAQSSSSLMLGSPTLSDSPLLDLDHASSLLAMNLPSAISKSSAPLFRGDVVPLVDDVESLGHVHTDAVCISTGFRPFSTILTI